MAFSPLRSKALHHNRSLSFPSKETPSTSHLDSGLSAARACNEASCSSLPSMNNRVKALQSLYINIDDLLQQPHIHQIISQESQEKPIHQVLDGYIRILDVCTAAKDLVSTTKHDVQELLSALRRKDVTGITSYLSSRKLSKKNILKSLKRSKHMIHILSTSEKGCGEESDFVQKLKEAESVTISMLESLVSYLVGTRQISGWSLVTKVMLAKKREDLHSNEFKKIDALLQKGIQTEEVMNLSKEIESNVQNLEEEIECLFRQLIRTRVFLLNILNN